MGLHLAMIFALDMDRMTAFYRDAIGLEPVAAESTAEWRVFEAGGARFALHAVPDEVAAGIAEPGIADERSEVPVKLVFDTQDLGAACHRVVECGGRLLPHRIPAMRDVCDPEGNILVLMGR